MSAASLRALTRKIVAVISSAAAATLAAPGIASLAKRDAADDDRGDGVGPPPAGDRVGRQPRQKRRRHECAEHGLATLAGDSRRVQLLADAALGGGERRHRGERDYREADTKPADVGVIPLREIAERLDPHICGKQDERHGDELLRTALGPRRGDALARHEPQDDEPGERLDEAVGAESPQRDRARNRAGTNRDSGLGEMPAEPEPRQPTRAKDELDGWLTRGRLDLDDRKSGQEGASSITTTLARLVPATATVAAVVPVAASARMTPRARMPRRRRPG